jgi:hypothetical protein
MLKMAIYFCGCSAKKASDLCGSPWRWRWDLNPRLSFPNTRFRGVLLWPLGHATRPEDTVINFLFAVIEKMIAAARHIQC